MVTLKDLVISNGSEKMSHLIQDCPLVLSADTSLKSIAFHDVWKTEQVLPVVNENDVLLGALEYNKIVAAIQNQLSSEQKEKLVDSIADIMLMFSHTAENIINDLSKKI